MNLKQYPQGFPSWKEGELQSGRDPAPVTSSPTEDIIGGESLVDSDDWELGPACGLDPEVCESCQ